MRLRQCVTILSDCLAHAYLVVYAQKTERSEPLFSYLIGLRASARPLHAFSHSKTPRLWKFRVISAGVAEFGLWND